MSVILPSSRWKRKQRKRMKKISTLWRALPIMSEKCVPPNSQHYHMPIGHDFQKRDHLCLLYRLTGYDLLYTWLILFPPSASQWLHPSHHLSGHSPTSQAPMSWGSRCSPSHITELTTRQKAAEGLSKLRPAATLWFRYGLEFSSFCVLIYHWVIYFCWATAWCFLGWGMCLSLLLLWGMGYLRLSIRS